MKLAPKQIAQAGAATGNPLLWSGSKYTPAPNVAMALSGLDGSQTVGAAQIDAPSGISTIAAGATTCVVTNSLATAYCKVTLEWYGDHGATRSWVVRANGSFTVTLSSAASANTSFGWTVSGMTSSMLSGLIHYWSLDGNSNDAFTTGNGTDTAVVYTTPKLGSACAAFNGTTSKVVTASMLKPLTWTMSCWMNVATQQGTAWRMGAEVVGQLAMLTYTGGGNWSVGNAAISVCATPITPGAWTLMTITYDGTSATAYKNGALAAGPTAIAIASSTNVTNIGNYNVTSFFPGLIDDTCMWDRALTAGEVASLYNSGNGLETMSGSLLTGLIHQWHLNGNSNDNVGTANGTDTAVVYGGKSGACALFNGSTSKIQTAIDGPLGAAPRSISCWFNRSSGNSAIIRYGVNSATNFFQIGVTSGNRFRVYTGTDDIIDVAITAGVWHHAVVTYNGTTTAAYIDGGAPTTSAATISTLSGSIVLGHGPTYGYMTGLIDEPAMWNRALTAAEVTALYNAGAGRYYPAFV